MTCEIIIISGFLGSGKTTLLQQLLVEERQAGRKVAVLMNEMGQYSIDSDLLDDKTPLAELTSGCICCTVKDQLETSLLELYKQHKPERIYIETTGVAHPIEVLDACLTPIIAPYVHIRSIITVVDGEKWQTRATQNRKLQRLMEEQVKHADIVLVTKAEADLPNAKRSLTVADIYDAGRTTIPEHETVHVKRDLHIEATCYTFTHPIERDVFDSWLRALPTTVHRVKGFVRFNGDEPYTTLVQYAYGMPMFVRQSVAFPNTVVIIGENLAKATLVQSLQLMDVTL